MIIESTIVVDEDASYFMGSTSIVPEFNPHPLTNDSMRSQEGLVFVQAKSIRPKRSKSQLDYIPLLSTSDSSWADSDDQSSRKTRGQTKWSL